MQDFKNQAEEILKSEMTNSSLEICIRENGREGFGFTEILRRFILQIYLFHIRKLF